MTTKHSNSDDLVQYEARTGRQAIKIQGKDDQRPRLVEKKVELVEEFAFLFYKNMKTVLKNHPLSGNDLLVLFELLGRWNMKNPMGLIGISQSSVAKELGQSRQQVNRSCLRLETAGLLVKDAQGDIHINPAVLLKGSPKDLYGSRAEVLEAGLVAIGVASVVR